MLLIYVAVLVFNLKLTDQLTNRLTDYMEQSPSWDVNSCSASQEIPNLSWNTKVHCCVQNSLPLVPILRQMNPVHTFPRSVILAFHVLWR